MIENNYKLVQNSIAKCAVKSGRNPEEIQLVAVTKTVTWQEAEILYRCGQRDFGENRLQEAFHKQEESPKDCRWHLIGSLQSKKARKAVGKFALIHSVDSLELAQKLSVCSLEENISTQILLQINTSGEAAKHGMTVDQCRRSFEVFTQFPNLSIQGLMTMAPFVEDEIVVRKCFAELRNLRDELKLHHLSMGMTNDYMWAIDEGATIVRIGTALFEA